MAKAAFKIPAAGLRLPRFFLLKYNGIISIGYAGIFSLTVLFV